VFVATIIGTSGVPAMELAWVTPAILAACIGLASGTLAIDGLLQPRRRALAYAVGVAGSSFVAWTAVGYGANLLLDPIALALILAAVLAAFRRRGVIVGVLLVAAAGITHWVFAAIVIAILGALALALLLAARLPAGSRPPGGAAWRVGGMALGGSAIAVALLAVPELSWSIPTIDPAEREPLKVSERLPSMALWLTGPIAVVGGILGLGRGSLQRRWMAGLLLGWVAIGLLGVAGWFLGFPTPPYRSAGFALGIPLLIVFAAAELGDRLLGGRGPVRSVARAVLILTTAAALAAVGASVWWTEQPKIRATGFQQLETVERYLDAVGFEGDVLFTQRTAATVGLREPSLRAVFPLELTHRAAFHELRFPRSGERLDAPADAVVVYLSAYDRRPAPPGATLAPGVVVLQGPPLTADFEPAPAFEAPPPSELIGVAVGALVVLGLVGSGWTWLLELGTVGRIGLAPVLGAAMVPLVGLVTSRLGLPFDRTGSAVLLAGVLALGWAAGAAAWLARRRTPGRHARGS
jgi:hypothetical protein